MGMSFSELIRNHPKLGPHLAGMPRFNDSIHQIPFQGTEFTDKGTLLRFNGFK